MQPQRPSIQPGSLGQLLAMVEPAASMTSPTNGGPIRDNNGTLEQNTPRNTPFSRPLTRKQIRDQQELEKEENTLVLHLSDRMATPAVATPSRIRRASRIELKRNSGEVLKTLVTSINSLRNKIEEMEKKKTDVQDAVNISRAINDQSMVIAKPLIGGALLTKSWTD